MDKKFVIFDMDGTLIDSMPYWNICIEGAARRRGVSSIPQDLRARTVAMAVPDCCDAIIKNLNLTCDASEMVNEIYAEMKQYYMTEVPLKDGVLEYLEKLKNSGVKMCTASATREDQQRLILERLGILDYFVDTVSCDRVGVSKSNGADIYDYCTRLLGADKQSVAVFEDSHVAARTARSAGYYTVGCCDEASKDYWDELISLSNEHFQSWRSIHAQA